MKKTYIIPTTAVVPVNVKGTILSASLVKNETETLDDPTEILTQQESEWDIWSKEEEEYEEEYADYYEEY